MTTTLTLHFADRLDEIERRLKAGAGHAEAFAGVDDDLFALMTLGDYPGREAVKAALPAWPEESHVIDCTGNLTLFEAVKEAALFWRLAKEAYARHGGGRPIGEARVVDYGAGWGRVTRFCAKDVRRVVAVEPNPAFQALFRETRVPAELVASDWLSAAPLPVKDVDLAFCFSILTHASDQLSRNIAARWGEMMRPGGVVVCTIRPGVYLDDEGGGEISRVPADERLAMKAAYAAGELAYWPYPGSPDWGITITPMAHLERVFGPDFEIVGPRYFLQNFTQLPIVLVRRGGPPRAEAAPRRLGWRLFGG
jgi:SAM-dependent methyltransferase